MTTTSDSSASERVENSQMPSGSFEELGLSEQVLKGLGELGYQGPTPVQRETYAQVVDGHDLIVQAKTGSGKTAAFGVPIVQRLGQHLPDRIRSLTLCPTRELAMQVARELAAIGRHTGLRVTCIYGGAAFGPQLDALRGGVDIVVGTPGRVLDHMRRGTLRVERVEFMVLDEADEMLSMGFWEEVTSVLERIRGPHQTLLFSATLPQAIQTAAARYLRDPQRIELSGDEMTVAGIANVIYRVDDTMPKPRAFLHVIEVEKPDSAIVFCNRRGETELIYSVLRRFGFKAGLLNSDLGQRERERVMAQVKAHELPLLVATDVAARGIDISELSHVFNYDLPEHTEVYLHRAGRTGRIGKRGAAVSLIRGLSASRLREIERLYDVQFEERTLPSAETIVEIETDRILRTLFTDAEHVEASQYLQIARSLMDRDQGAEAVAFLLRTYFSEERTPGQRTGRGRMDSGSTPQRVLIDAGADHNLDEATLRQVLHTQGQVPESSILEVQVEPDRSFADIEAEVARELLQRSEALTLPDGRPLTLRAERSHRGPERSGRSGGDRSSRGGRQGPPRGRSGGGGRGRR
ncbi:MAG: DEAD/DEAH box helicase [Pseudomonadota bacterium]